MKAKDLPREMVFEMVLNQIRNNDPPETRIHYDRLRNLGYNDEIPRFTLAGVSQWSYALY